MRLSFGTAADYATDNEHLSAMDLHCIVRLSHYRHDRNTEHLLKHLWRRDAASTPELALWEPNPQSCASQPHNTCDRTADLRCQDSVPEVVYQSSYISKAANR